MTACISSVSRAFKIHPVVSNVTNLIAKNQFKVAIQQIESIPNIYWKKKKSLLGTVFYCQKEYDQALEIFSSKCFKSDQQILVVIAKIHFFKKNFSLFRETTKKLEIKSYEIQFLEIKVLIHEGKFKESIVKLGSLLHSSHLTSEVIELYFNALLKIGKCEKFDAYLRSLLSENPNNNEVIKICVNLINHYCKIHYYSKAEAFVLFLLIKCHQKQNEIKEMWGKIRIDWFYHHLKRGEFSKAQRFLNDLLKDYPGKKEIYLLYEQKIWTEASYNFRLRKYNRAKILCEIILEKNPDHQVRALLEKIKNNIQMRVNFELNEEESEHVKKFLQSGMEFADSDLDDFN